MRIFVSLPVIKEVTQEIILIQEQLKKSDLFTGSYIKPENLHITLAFIGEIQNNKLSKIISNLNNIKFELIKISLSKLNLNIKNKVIWLIVKSEKLKDLAYKIRESLLEFSVDQENKFIGHISLLRIKSDFDINQAKNYLDKINFKQITWQANKFNLTESILSQDNSPIYKTVSSFSLIK